jgi:hypothetical protein
VGLEAACTAKLGAAASRGKALLETTELVFRGDFRVRVPLSEVKSVRVDGGRLSLRFRGQALTLELGAAAAERWADKIRHPPSRLDKLGVKPTSRVAVVGGHDDDFLAELAARGAAVVRGAAGAPVDLLFYAAGARADLHRLSQLARALQPDGALWVVRPKGHAAITERDVMAAGKAAGLVDVKVAAFSATHTAAKFVIPVALRSSRATGKSPPARRSRSAPAKTPPRPARRAARRG